MEYRTGDILEYEGLYICQGVNSLGVMGVGLALDIRNKYPKVFDVYISKPRKLGQVFGVDCGEHIILNIVTQKEIGRSKKPFNYTAFELGLSTLDENIEGDVAFPMIGCGYGGANWKQVKEIIDRVCININPIVYTLNDEILY